MSHEPDSAFPVLISTLGINLDPQSRKQVESISFEAGDTKKQFQQAISAGRGLLESFDPPLEVLLDAKIVVSVQCRKAFRGAVTISLDPRDVLYEATEENGKQLYRKTERKVEVVIGIQSLPSTVGEIMASCSRFRVLIIGEAGVGKSSLINKVFGVTGVNVSDTTRGQASIDQEYIAPDNAHFVVHDSCGFEAADQQNLETVREFISRRRCRRDLKDQLHAVWLCLAIPFAGSRLLQAGVEYFLQQRQEILGNIPLVIVFTKLDLLVNMLEIECLENGELCHEPALKERTQESLNKLCLGPIRTAVGNISHVAVSTINGYENSLSTLIEETTRSIQTYVEDEAAQYIAMIAQRVNISLKVALTMAVGEKRYWKALMASPNFRGHTIKACLHVIHKDIIAVWNFNDPDNTLMKDDFKAHLLNTPNLVVREAQDFPNTVKTSVTMLAALVTIIAGVAGTGGAALPIVIPVVGVAVLGKLAHDLYKASQDVVRQLMAYIIDLTCVMQIVFLLASTRNGVINVELVGNAMRAYDQVRNNVHADVNAFQVNLAVVPGKRDHVLDKIKELIMRHSIGDEALSTLRRELS